MIRPATDADLPAIAAVHVEAWAETYGAQLGEAARSFRSPDQRLAQWRARIEAGDTDLFLAEDSSGACVGFIAAGRVFEPDLGADGEFSALYLLRAAQGRGLGRHLMQAGAAALLARGCRSGGLRVMGSNALARGFYRALGGIERNDGRRFSIAGVTFDDIAVIWPDLGPLAAGVPTPPDRVAPA